MGIDELLAPKRFEILALGKKHGARNIRVFGSVARGEAGPQSDVDLLIELEPGRSLFDHAQLLLALQALLKRRVDVVTVAALRPQMRDRVLREAVAL